MIFQKESIEAILAGRKTMTRRLVKENEGFSGDSSSDYYCTLNLVFSKDIKKETCRVKWQVGNKYAVCPGRGKPTVIYCPKCKTIIRELAQISDMKTYFCKCEQVSAVITGMSVEAFGSFIKLQALEFKRKGWKPLFIELVSIRKEKLKDITPIDALREGFMNKQHFLSTFNVINKHKSYEVDWNPEVWVLEFRRV